MAVLVFIVYIFFNRKGKGSKTKHKVNAPLVTREQTKISTRQAGYRLECPDKIARENGVIWVHRRYPNAPIFACALTRNKQLKNTRQKKGGVRHGSLGRKNLGFQKAKNVLITSCLSRKMGWGFKLGFTYFSWCQN